MQSLWLLYSFACSLVQLQIKPCNFYIKTFFHFQLFKIVTFYQSQGPSLCFLLFNFTNKSYHYTFNYFPLQYRNNNILARQRVQSYSKYCHYNEIDVIQYKLKCSSTFTLWSLLVIYGLVCSSGLINHNCKPVSFYSKIYIYV